MFERCALIVAIMIGVVSGTARAEPECHHAFSGQTFAGQPFANVQQEMHDIYELRRIEFIERNTVANIRNPEVLKESLAALMRKPSQFEAMSFDTLTDSAVVLYREVIPSPDATLFILADQKNQTTYAEIVRDLIGLHGEIFSKNVTQLNFFIPVERADLAKNVVDAAKELGFASTTIETDPEKMTRSLLPGDEPPVDEFFDLVEIYSPLHVPTSGDFYAVTVYLNP